MEQEIEYLILHLCLGKHSLTSLQSMCVHTWNRKLITHSQYLFSPVENVIKTVASEGFLMYMNTPSSSTK